MRFVDKINPYFKGENSFNGNVLQSYGVDLTVNNMHEMVLEYVEDCPMLPPLFNSVFQECSVCSDNCTVVFFLLFDKHKYLYLDK